MFLSYLGLLLLVWMFIGLSVGAKNLYIDRSVTHETLRATLEEMDENKIHYSQEALDFYSMLIDNKAAYLAMAALSGGLMLYWETKDSF